MTNLPEPYNWLLPIGTVLVTGLGMMGLTVAKRGDLADALRNAGFIRPPNDRRAALSGADRLRRHERADRRTDHGRRRLGLPVRNAVVPRFVVAELQHIADNRDQARRVRGRRGLEVLNVLQKDHRIAIELSDEDPTGIDAVDAKLVELARRRGAGILTDDYNLNRVAQLDDVRVLNLNQLANALKPAFLPGDALQVKVIQQGKEPGQGLAYLDDGTMIVVEGGGTMLDKRDRGHRRPRAPDSRRPDGLCSAPWLSPARTPERFADAVIVAAGSSLRMGGLGQDRGAGRRANRCWTGRSRPCPRPHPCARVVVVARPDRVEEVARALAHGNRRRRWR